MIIRKWAETKEELWEAVKACPEIEWKNGKTEEQYRAIFDNLSEGLVWPQPLFHYPSETATGKHSYINIRTGQCCQVKNIIVDDLMGPDVETLNWKGIFEDC